MAEAAPSRAVYYATSLLRILRDLLMKIRFLEDTFIRSEPRRGALPPIGIILKGAIIEVDATPVEGDTVSNLHFWYKDHNGWYYWIGRTERIQEVALSVSVQVAAPAPPAPTVTPPPSTAPPVITVPVPVVPDSRPVESNGAIPPGETRTVPTLAELLRAVQ
jgi:hypothetical protein